MRASRTTAWRCGLVVAWTSSSAYADTGGRAAAQVLFDEARQLMASGNVAEACPKLQESQRIDPGGGTILLLARCHAKEGKTASAWTEYQDALRSALTDKRKERERLARDEGAALEPRLSRLAIEVPPSSLVPGLTVLRDGQEVGPAQWKIAVPLDPGRHDVAVSAPGRAPWSTTVDVRGEGRITTVSVPSLRLIEAPPSPRPLVEATPRAEAAIAASDAPPRVGATQRVVGVVVAALGLGAAGAGAAYAYGKAKPTYSRSSGAGACDANNDCTADAKAIRDRAFAQANVATVLVGVGAAAVVGGATIWLTAPRSPAAASSVALGYRGGQLIVQGAW